MWESQSYTNIKLLNTEFLYIELSFIEVEVEYRDFQLFEAVLVQSIFTYVL